ncbi:MAG: hypothetical protein BGO31_02225 [Bacteroidetes bacterium 43-16]|nr:MAG: hypothetical protein BGO31_02225 [Bacteroidetes bacterium 43-16]
MKDLLFTFFCATFFVLQASAQTSKELYEIYDTKSGNKIDWDTWVTKNLAEQQIILWGEEHNDSIGHLLQKDMLQSLQEHSKSTPLAFSMEMFQTDVQLIMDEYLSGWISEKNFKTESRVWNNYKDYAAMVNFSKENKIPVICANTPSRYTNMVTRGNFKALDVLPKHTKKAYLPPFPLDTLSGRYAEKFLEAMGGHVNPNMFIYQSQNLWDATMAHNILKASKKHRVFHIVGRFHTDEYQGTAARVLKGTKKKVATVSCFPAATYKADEYKKLADYVVLTKGAQPE